MRVYSAAAALFVVWFILPAVMFVIGWVLASVGAVALLILVCAAAPSAVFALRKSRFEIVTGSHLASIAALTGMNLRSFLWFRAHDVSTDPYLFPVIAFNLFVELFIVNMSLACVILIHAARCRNSFLSKDRPP